MSINCQLNCIGSLPESLTQELLVGKLLVGGLGVLATEARPSLAAPRQGEILGARRRRRPTPRGALRDV